MPSKALVALIALAMIGASSVAMARGGSGGMSGGGHSGHGHMARFHHFHHFHHRFQNDQAFFGGLGWGWGYGDSGYGNTTVLAYPQATPQTADMTGAVRATPCHWAEDTFNVPAAAGGTRPIAVVSCR
jgi:hypothetical protein